MEEAYVRLVCPECRKEWESTPRDLPAPEELFTCPDCAEQRRLSEFMRTDRDLETLRELR
ncbi:MULTISPECIES: hypothetical protein [unclassified Halorhabdus]|uniref:DUF7836 family putative zinc-binding protein n=1 Tax=unclassified Halorhabdus TaxID=2621901 RepID=UPI0023DC4CCC|nr:MULTISPECIES: hypothetical protein [unclassified Halorhabdus]WEL16977.1 Uncharacterized protein SVXHr_0798 [Halorhabdus sp. SVX81]WEL20856.1 Uncharacterized protein HBNXHr_0783 [Halorhabdus sp. BNX81]